MSQQDPASPVEEMDIERLKSTSPTLFGKGKEKLSHAGTTQIKKSVDDYLRTFGLGKGTPLMEIIGNLVDRDLTKEGMTTMTLILGLAQQVNSLTASEQNLSLLVQDRNTTTANVRIRKLNEEQKTASEPEPKGQTGGKSYAEAAAAKSHATDPRTPSKCNRKRKGSAGPTSRRPLQVKIVKEGGEDKKAKRESAGWKTVGPAKSRAAKAAKPKMIATLNSAIPLSDPTRKEV